MQPLQTPFHPEVRSLHVQFCLHLLFYRMIKEANRRPLHAINFSFPSRNRNTPISILYPEIHNM
jgi:hypothetical protein